MNALTQSDPHTPVHAEAIPDQVVVFIAPAKAVMVLRAVLDHLPYDLSAAIVILLHTGTGQERPVANNLNVNPHPMVLPGAAGVQLRRNHAYIVHPEQKLAFGDDANLVDAPEPESGDDGLPLLTTLASRYGVNGVAIALTALGHAESKGFRLVREANGHTFALDESDRLWADASGPRVVPAPGDELLLASAIGDRIRRVLAPGS